MKMLLKSSLFLIFLMTTSWAAGSLSSAEELLDLQYGSEKFCIQSVKPKFYTFKSCINVGNQIHNTLVDVANFATLGKAGLAKKLPYTNCLASKTLVIKYKHSNEDKVLTHKITKKKKFKYDQIRDGKKLLSQTVNQEANQLIKQLKELPSCEDSKSLELLSLKN